MFSSDSALWKAASPISIHTYILFIKFEWWVNRFFSQSYLFRAHLRRVDLAAYWPENLHVRPFTLLGIECHDSLLITPALETKWDPLRTLLGPSLGQLLLLLPGQPGCLCLPITQNVSQTPPGLWVSHHIPV